MKNIKNKLLVGAITLALTLGMSSCQYTEAQLSDAVDRATAELESKVELLEKEKAELEADIVEKDREIKCLKGDHVFDSEHKITYATKNYKNESEYEGVANLTCVYGCEYEISGVITEDEPGAVTFKSDDGSLERNFTVPYVTSWSINTNSKGYDLINEEFYINEDTPFIVTIKGKNLDQQSLMPLSVFIISDGDYNPLNLLNYDGAEIIDSETIVWEITPDKFTELLELSGYESCDGIGVLNYHGILENESYKFIDIQLGTNENPSEVDGEWIVVSDAEELLAAVAKGGKIRLENDIDIGEEYFGIDKSVSLDLNGKTLRTSFWSGLYVTLEGTLDIYGGTVEQNGEDEGSAIINYGIIKVSDCRLVGKDYYALYVSDGNAEVKNTTLVCGAYASNSYTDTADIMAVENVTVEVGECGISVTANGTITLGFDPTEMLDTSNEGTVIDNGDGTWTLKVVE